jgi:hypothetical protein
MKIKLVYKFNIHGSVFLFVYFAVPEIWQILETLVEFTLLCFLLQLFLSVGDKNSQKEKTLVGSLSVFLIFFWKKLPNFNLENMISTYTKDFPLKKWSNSRDSYDKFH